MSSGQHPDTGGLEARDMGALINPPREPRYDNVACLSQTTRQTLGEREPGSGSVARPDDCDRRLAQGLCAAPESENWRRGIDLLQRRRIVRLR